MQGQRYIERRVVVLATGAVLAAIVGLMGAAFGVSAAAATTSARPNILIFLTDDQRAGYSMAMMPNAHRIMAEGGTKFDHAYVTTPECCPSRSSIFSGKYAHNTGILTNDGTGFNAGQTWEHYLHYHGYFTGLVGKYLNKVPTADAPYFDYTNRGQTARQSEITTINEAVRGFFSRAHQRGRPWALVVATYSPHAPWTTQPVDPLAIPPYKPEPSYQEADRSDKDQSVRAVSHTNAEFEDAYKGQQMEVQAADREFQNVFKQMRVHDEATDTLSFFLSDNGYYWGEHGLLGKGFPYREDVRVPFYVRWPGHIAQTSWITA